MINMGNWLFFFFFFLGALSPISSRPGEGWHIKPAPSLLVSVVGGEASQAESPTVSKLQNAGSNNGRLGDWRQLIGLLLLQSAKSFCFLFCCFADLIRPLCDFCIVNLSVYKLPHYVNAECFKTQIYAQRAWIFEVFEYYGEIILLSSCGRYRTARGYMAISSGLCRWWPVNIQGGKSSFITIVYRAGPDGG